MRSLSISINVNIGGFFNIILSVNLPLPGPISNILSFSESNKIRILVSIF